MVLVCLPFCLKAQDISWIKAAHTSDNNDKRLFPVERFIEKGKYLGTLLVAGKVESELLTWKEIYKRAKFLGANAYDIHYQSLEPNSRSNLMEISFWYTSAPFKKLSSTLLFVFALEKKVKYELDNIQIILPAGTFSIHEISNPIRVRTGGFLGSAIRLYAGQEPVSYFYAVDGFDIQSDKGFLNILTGDLIALEEGLGYYLSKRYIQINSRGTVVK